MAGYVISEECRHLLDAILPTFNYDRLADIRGAIEKTIITEKGDASAGRVYSLYLSIIAFLERYQFGHSVDYVFMIDKKGEDLKNSGSLRAYEEKEGLN